MAEWYEFTKENYEEEKIQGLDPKVSAIFKLLNQRVMMMMFVSPANQIVENERVKRSIDYNREQAIIIRDIADG